jgi:ceramide glucosyltransferase
MVAVWRFGAQQAAAPAQRPAISVLIPMCGAEPLLEAALRSFGTQRYPAFQMILGVQDPGDPALGVARRVQAAFPALDISVVVDRRMHGTNGKISNLINMLPEALHDLLVLADSDLHVAPDYLDCIVAALEPAGVGLVTTVCAGLPTSTGLAARLGAESISHVFLPGALLSRELGRQDCLGATMALRRDTLTQAGGLERLVNHLADDNVLGRRVAQLGLGTALAATVPLTGVPEASLRSLWRHEMRWARTIRALEPALFGLSALQFPLFWAAAAFALSGVRWAAGLFIAAWALRAASVCLIDRSLLRGRASGGALSVWLLPLREGLSISQIAASFLSSRVVWRGQVMRADNGRASGPMLSPGAAPLTSFVRPTRPI